MCVSVTCFGTLLLLGCGGSSPKEAIHSAGIRGGETRHAQGAEKIRLIEVTLTPPECFCPIVVGGLEIAGGYEIRPTDAANGDAASRKEFWVVQTAVIQDDGGEAVRSLAEQVRVDIPPRASATDYYPQDDIVCVWDGRNRAGEMVPDGTYTWLVDARYARLHDAGNSARTQEHLVGVSNTISGTIVVDTVPRTVVSTYPAEGAVDVPLDTAARLPFSGSMNTGSVEQQFVLRESETGTEVEGSFDWPDNAMRMVFLPLVDLLDNTVYEFTFRTPPLDSRGVELDGDGDGGAGGDFSSFFTTVNLLRTVRALPAKGETDVPLLANVVLLFNASMDTGSVERQFVLRESETGTEVDGSFTWQNATQALFTPSGPLHDNTVYEFTFRTPPLDSWGVELDGDGDGRAGGDFHSYSTTVEDVAAPSIKLIVPYKHTSAGGRALLIGPKPIEVVTPETPKRYYDIWRNVIGHDTEWVVQFKDDAGLGRYLVQRESPIFGVEDIYSGNLGGVRERRLNFNVFPAYLEDGKYTLYFHVWDLRNNDAGKTTFVLDL